MTEISANSISRETSGRRIGCRVALIAAFLICAFTILYNIGHYALWDDEAMTALLGESVWRTGDTSIYFGHNIIAYEGGMLVKNGRDQYEPPLQFYLAAPFVGLFGNHAWAARLPFALCGLGCIALMLFWLDRDEAELSTTIFFCAGIITSTALILYFRQARYYAPAIFLSVLIAYLYLHWKRGFWNAAILSMALALLFLDQYLNYGALCLCLVVDYLLFRRRQIHPGLRDWLIILIPQVLAIGWILLFRFPPGAGTVASFQGHNTPLQKCLLFIYSFQGLNINEMIPVVILPAAVVIAWICRDRSLFRALITLTVFLAVMSATVPTDFAFVHGAEVRYLAPIIPLGILIEVLVIRRAWRHWPMLTALFAGVLFLTTVFYQPVWSPDYRVPLRSTIAQYWRELLNPHVDTYTAAADWILKNTSGNQTIWVSPSFNIYPLMFIDPGLVYGWQIQPGDPRFAGAPAINFRGVIAPDFIIFFGLHADDVKELEQLSVRQKYHLIKKLDVYYLDRPRPEISWRRFKPITGFGPRDAIYIFGKSLAQKE